MTNIFEIIKPPFHYNDYGQIIFDKNNNLIIDVRMCGLLSKYDNAEELQDGFGKMLAETLTNIAQQSLSGSDDKSSYPKLCPYCNSKAKPIEKRMVYRCTNDNCGISGHDF